MVGSGTKRALLGISLALPALLGAAPEPPPDTPQSPGAHVVTYDASGSAEFHAQVDHAARVWNASAHNVHFVPSPGPADVVVLADDGWPRTRVDALGSGEVRIGRQAVRAGYDLDRVTAHEFGHVLGLVDTRSGLCRELMSGHSASVRCPNPWPDGAEVAAVERNFRPGAPPPARLYVDSAPR